jgi:hypothetical protein
MAIYPYKTGNHVQQGTIVYVMDTEAELTSVPTTHFPGSLCFCIENNKTYILTSKLKWVEKTCGGGGGGSEYPSADDRKFPIQNDNITFKTQSQYYNEIVEAINGKLGTSFTYTPKEMADAIDSISTGKTYPNAEEVEF